MLPAVVINLVNYTFNLFIIGSTGSLQAHSGVMEGIFGYISPKPEQIWMKPGI